MKEIAAVLFICLSASKFSVFGQSSFEKNMRDKEKKEIEYLTDCIKANRKVDSLIEWKLSSKDEGSISYKYKRDRLAFFELQKNKSDIFLHAIDYYHRSFEKMIFLDEKLIECKMLDQTRFGVWMSNDKLSIYFCMINQAKVTIWVLSNGDTVYTV